MIMTLTSNGGNTAKNITFFINYFIQKNFCGLLVLIKIVGRIMKNAIQEIAPLSRHNVYIKNADKLNKVLNNMALGGINKLQIVSDFDRTITKQHQDGVPHLSSFAMFSKIPATAKNEHYQNTVLNLRKKYYPIEVDPAMPRKEKVKHMEDWWSLSEKALSGLIIPQHEIENVCVELKPSLRDGSDAFFKELAEKEVPVLVFSAGCGNIVSAVLKHCGVYLPNVKVISNFLNYDEKGVITGFQDKIIHVFNKNEYAIKNTEFYDVVVGRQNAIVLGDSLGDANMTEGMDNLENVLKIGFLYEHVDESLPAYMDTFDIVLVDDQTMDVPKAIFDYITNTDIAN